MVDDPKEGKWFADLGYRAILDSLPCYLSIQDRSFRILVTNQTFRSDFGEAVGRKCYEVYKKSSVRCQPCPLWKTLQDKRVHTSEETVQLSDGKIVQVAVYSAPVLDAMGNVVAAVELSANIGKVKEIQEELTILGQSVAVLSHDIKNILEGLHGGAYVVDEGLKDSDQDLIRKGWAVVKKNIYEITWLVQNILYFSKKRRPSYEAISLDVAFMKAIEVFSEKAGEIDCSLRARVNPKLPPVCLDPGALRRMLINLVSNAVEACSRDKEKPSHSIVLRADFMDEDHVMIEVEDDGIGMDSATCDKIFSRFFSTKGVDGTGLGLMVIHEIVEEHEGRAEVVSRPGTGSMFRIILPFKQRKPLLGISISKPDIPPSSISLTPNSAKSSAAVSEE